MPREVFRVGLGEKWRGARLPADNVTFLSPSDEQVWRTPDAVAVVTKGEQLTHGELNRRALTGRSVVRGSR
jgi:hypothetical protein